MLSLRCGKVFEPFHAVLDFMGIGGGNYGGPSSCLWKLGTLSYIRVVLYFVLTGLSASRREVGLGRSFPLVEVVNSEAVASLSEPTPISFQCGPERVYRRLTD